MNKTKRFTRVSKLVVLILVLSMFAAGCGNQAVAGVSTEVTATAAPSDTPVPTSTSTATPVPTDTPTATPTVTSTATPNAKATREAKQTATQAALNEMVEAELAKYAIDPALGQVAWVMEEPVILDGAGFAQGFYESIEDVGVVKDFVIQYDVTWDTSGGLAGCGLLFRAPEDWDMATGDFYALNLIRLQYAPAWFVDYYNDGRWEYSIPSGSGVPSANIIDEKMTKNTVTMDVRGDTFTVYINGVKERAVENNKIDEGGLGFLVIQNSGTSYCKFENSWVWTYNE